MPEKFVVGVHGALRRGASANDKLTGLRASYLGETTLTGYTLYVDANHVAKLVKDGSTNKVKVEKYRVGPQGRAMVDGFEAVSCGHVATTADDGTEMVCINEYQGQLDGLAKIEGGDFLSYWNGFEHLEEAEEEEEPEGEDEGEEEDDAIHLEDIDENEVVEDIINDAQDDGEEAPALFRMLESDTANGVVRAVLDAVGKKYDVTLKANDAE